MLHIVKHYRLIIELAPFCCKTDAVLLMEDAVYGAVQNHVELSSLLEEIGRVFLLQEDVIARGLKLKEPSFFQLVNFDGFVSLTEEHNSSMTWE